MLCLPVSSRSVESVTFVMMISPARVNLLRFCCRCANLNSVQLPHYPLRCELPFKPISTSAITCRRKLTAEEALKSNNEILRNDDEYADTFGNLSVLETRFERVRDDPEDIEEYKRSRRAPGRTFNYYKGQIINLLKNHEYDKALNMLEVDMINDRHQVHHYLYRLFLSYNSKIGDIKEAYRIFISYKRRGGKINGGMYTSLFDACANSENSFLALEKAEAIRRDMNEKKFTINLSHYNAMLKAYGRHGDLPNCMKIVDEVLHKRDKVSQETYCFLLQACISDRNSGLRHGLMVWRKMLQNRCAPTIFDFNLILRCVRDCSLGDIELLHNFIKQLENESEKYLKRKILITHKNGIQKRKILNIPVPKEEAEKLLLAGSDKSEKSKSQALNYNDDDHLVENLDKPEGSDSIHSGDKCLTTTNEILLYEKSPSTEPGLVPNVELPNLLSLKPVVGSVIGFGSMTKSYERFMCLGGLKGFLNTMKEFGVKPNVKTFTLLLDVMPRTLEAEEQVIAEAKSRNIKLDTAFFNVLIKRRSIREKNALLQETLKEMQLAEVTPDLVTFGVIALGCATHESGIELIKAVRSSGHRLNSEILGGLLQRANDAQDMNYVKTILEAAKEDETNLSGKFTAALGNIVKREKLRRVRMMRDSESKEEAVLDAN